ncbi:MAG: serine hydrolase domain-containing protein [Ferruginibacter sp.]
MKSLLLIVQLLLVAVCYSQTVRHLDDLSMNTIDAAIMNEISQSSLPGVSVGIIYNGRVAYTKAYGQAAPGVNATTSTKYPIASVSKTITGIMAMKMIENNDIGLDDLIRDHVSGYYSSGITIRHLLSHQSGIGHYNNCPGGYSGAFSAAASLDVVHGCSICMGPPGSGTLYTTFGSTLLGVIINNVGLIKYGKTYTQLYNEWIRDAAGLSDLTAEYNNLINNIAVGYSQNGLPLPGYWDDIGWKLPAGGFVATAHDLAGFGVGVMNYTFLGFTASHQMWQKQDTTGSPINVCNDPLGNNYGLAFSVSSSGDSLRISHHGLNTEHGFASLLYLYPNLKRGIVLLTNKNELTGALDDILDAVDATLLCPANRDFTSQVNTIDDWVYEATAIQASNTFSAGTGVIVFDGANEVVLKPGFYAQAGINFRAVIDGCGGIVHPY